MNSFAPVDPALIDVVLPPSGYPDELAAADTPDALSDACGDAARDFPEAWYIDPKDWPDWARENDKNKTWPMNYSARYTNQNPTHECTCHSLTQNAESCRNRQRAVSFHEGPKKDFRYSECADIGSVFLTPMSVYPIANPNQWGGANVLQVLEIACRNGFLPDKIQPRDYGFKHTIHGTCGGGNSNQSSGPWVRESGFPAGWKETARWFKPLEVIIPRSWEQAVCLVLRGRMVSVGRNGHAIPWAQLMFDGSSLKSAAYPDSYNVTRYDSLSTIKSAWSGSFSIVSMTTPDDWMKPAG